MTKNVDLADILYSEGGVTQNDFKNGFQISQIIILFLISRFKKPIVSNDPRKIHLGYWF